MEATGTKIFFIGSHNAAYTAKLVNNVLSIGTNALISEAAPMGLRGGLDQKMVLSLLLQSSAVSYREAP